MPGLGTLINIAAIIAGGSIGCFFGGLLKDRVQEGLIMASAEGKGEHLLFCLSRHPPRDHHAFSNLDQASHDHSGPEQPVLGGVHPNLLRGSKPDFRAKDPRGQLPASLGFRCGLCFCSGFLAN